MDIIQHSRMRYKNISTFHIKLTRSTNKCYYYEEIKKWISKPQTKILSMHNVMAQLPAGIDVCRLGV